MQHLCTIDDVSAANHLSETLKIPPHLRGIDIAEDLPDCGVVGEYLCTFELWEILNRLKQRMGPAFDRVQLIPCGYKGDAHVTTPDNGIKRVKTVQSMYLCFSNDYKVEFKIGYRDFGKTKLNMQYFVQHRGVEKNSRYMENVYRAKTPLSIAKKVLELNLRPNPTETGFVSMYGNIYNFLDNLENVVTDDIDCVDFKDYVKFAEDILCIHITRYETKSVLSSPVVEYAMRQALRDPDSVPEVLQNNMDTVKALVGYLDKSNDVLTEVRKERHGFYAQRLDSKTKEGDDLYLTWHLPDVIKGLIDNNLFNVYTDPTTIKENLLSTSKPNVVRFEDLPEDIIGKMILLDKHREENKLTATADYTDASVGMSFGERRFFMLTSRHPVFNT